MTIPYYLPDPPPWIRNMIPRGGPAVSADTSAAPKRRTTRNYRAGLAAGLTDVSEPPEGPNS